MLWNQCKQVDSALPAAPPAKFKDKLILIQWSLPHIKRKFLKPVNTYRKQSKTLTLKAGEQINVVIDCT